MARKPNPEFGKRRPAVPRPPDPPSKRSNHVALLMMGTLAVGGGAYALMPRQNCQPVQPTPPGVTAPGAVPQPGADCTTRGSSSGSGGSSSHSSFYSGGSSSSSSSSTSSSSSSSSVSRGGFGSFAHAFGFGGS